MKLRLIDWNIGGGRHVEKSALLRFTMAETSGAIVVALQEVTPSAVPHYVALFDDGKVACSLAHRPPGPFDGGNRELGVMVGVVGAELERSSVLTNAPYPDRTLAAWFRLQDRHIHILAAHALTGVDYGRTKGDQFRALLTRLCAEELSHAPRLFALDANEPFVDAWDPAASEFAKRRGKGAALLFGADAPHGLSDALRVWLDARPNVAAELRKARPDGPLVVSHRTRTRDCRYDQCWISDDWHVEDVDYRYGAAVEAGSDHALVVVDLALVAEDLPRDAST